MMPEPTNEPPDALDIQITRDIKRQNPEWRRITALYGRAIDHLLANQTQEIQETPKPMQESIISPSFHPPTGIMGGSVHSYERSTSPWHRSAFPEHLQDQAPEQADHPAAGWAALDWCGNVIAFFPDGYTWCGEGRPLTDADKERLHTKDTSTGFGQGWG